ncbi:Oxidoreductase-like, N-terminal [Cinara cedri]|uniref:Oxidoreductase-like, N-terminal n=1 Tax=Cinara cedri TaxID=506608 RepID=A0A5E4N4D7_9HEMI|nr:Oxidoreductase-like, N-terminal [Cinara cedri]
MHFTTRSSSFIMRYVVLHKQFCSKSPPQLPEEPTTCCMSGCANCVWIEYAEKVKKILTDSDSKQVAQTILDKVQDPNMKAFLTIEFKSKGL